MYFGLIRKRVVFNIWRKNTKKPILTTKRVTKSLEFAKESFKVMSEPENPFISDMKMDKISKISIDEQNKSIAEFGDGVRDDLDCS